MEVYADIFNGHYEGNLMLEKPYFPQLEVCLQHFKKHLLASSCLSVHLSIHTSAWKNTAATGQILIKFEYV
jgi:hypothetical protein